MDLKKWHCFCMAAELGSLSRAAQLLEMAQSALSRQIALLEEECGGRLFHRTGRGVVLTELGQMVQPKARALLDQADRLTSDIRGAAGVPSGLVKLGVLPSTGRVLVSTLFEHLRSRFPDIGLHITEAFTGQLDEYRNSGRIDISVVNRYGPLERLDEPLGIFDNYLVGPADDAVTTGATIDFKKLGGLPLVLPGLPSGLRVRMEQNGRKAGITLNIVLEAEALSVMKEVVARSGIYTVLPSYAVSQEVKDGSLSISRLVKPVMRRVMCLDVSSVRPVTLASKEVAKAIRAISKDLMASGTWPRSLDH
jgi:LysR family nitrogen assimilation transcriptional regulator